MQLCHLTCKISLKPIIWPMINLETTKIGWWTLEHPIIQPLTYKIFLFTLNMVLTKISWLAMVKWFLSLILVPPHLIHLPLLFSKQNFVCSSHKKESYFRFSILFSRHYHPLNSFLIVFLWRTWVGGILSLQPECKGHLQAAHEVIITKWFNICISIYHYFRLKALSS